MIIIIYALPRQSISLALPTNSSFKRNTKNMIHVFVLMQLSAKRNSYMIIIHFNRTRDSNGISQTVRLLVVIHSFFKISKI